MLPLALDTLRRTARAPATWLLATLGLAAGWAGFALAILALGDAGSQALEVVVSTSLTWAALVTLQSLARALDQDESSALTDAVDAARPGQTLRRFGRWAGASSGGALTGILLAVALGLLGPPAAEAGLHLYIAIIVAAFQVGAWGLLLAAVAGARAVLGGGLVLWVLGHLPWGTAALLPGAVGRTLAALLPGPSLATADATPNAWIGAGLATAGLLAGSIGLQPLLPAGRRE